MQWNDTHFLIIDVRQFENFREIRNVSPITDNILHKYLILLINVKS